MNLHDKVYNAMLSDLIVANIIKDDDDQKKVMIMKIYDIKINQISDNNNGLKIEMKAIINEHKNWG